MRAASHCDVIAAARAVYALPAHDRRGALNRLVRAATWANRFRKQHRRAHPYWGDGSLMAAAMAENPPPEPMLADPDYCRCLSLVLERLSEMGMRVAT